MGRGTTDDRAQTNDGVVPIACGEAFGGNRDLKRARDSQHVDVFIADAMSHQSIESAFEQALGDKSIEATHDDAKTQAFTPQLSLDHPRHPSVSHCWVA
jgi:hypothetical protein